MGKDDIVNYLIDKYGRNYVSMVGNRLIYSGKSAIRDLGQVYEIPPSESQAASKEYNNELSVEENIVNSNTIKQYFETYSNLRDKVDKFVGTVSALGVHAGGVILSDSKRGYSLTRYCALQRPAEDGKIATLWTKKEVEQIGLIKYDILGLSSASQIHYAKVLIGVDPYKDFEEDEDVFKDIVFNKKHKNIFQFETSIGKKAFEDLMPMNIMELANASGIIRIVGSESGREIYNTYKKNVESIQTGDYDIWQDNLREEIYEDRNYEIAKEVLAESYGVLIYQEQLAYLINKFSNGEKTFVDGNKVRKLLDKLGETGTINDKQGNIEALKKWHTTFMEIISEYLLPYIGRDGSTCPNKIVQKFLKFELNNDNTLPIPINGIIGWFISSAAYLFSKLHAISYSINTYNMMYLKYYHPLEFWTASLICEQDNADKVKNYITAIQTEESFLKIISPCVNQSDFNFKMIKINDENKPDLIRYGLSAILGLNKGAKVIIEERKKHGEYKSIEDFIKRVPGRIVNKKIIKNLFYVGAFDCFGKQKIIYQYLVDSGKIEDDVEFDNEEFAVKENELLGVNLKYKHPILDSVKYYTAIDELVENQTAQIAIKILKSYTKTTKNGKPYVMLKSQCLNSNEVINVFVWDINIVESLKLKEGKMMILNIKKQGDFYQLAMSAGRK